MDRVKIAVRLVRDSEDYPPVDWELLWAIRRASSEFQVDNIPFFAKGISDGDIVTAYNVNGELVFDCVLLPGGHSTVRAILFGETDREKVRADLAKLGCETEASHLPSLISIDIPPEANYKAVVCYLQEAAEREELDYEEAAIRHS